MTRAPGKHLTSEEAEARWAFVQRRRGQGARWEQIAAELDLRPSTLRSWLDVQRRPDAPQPAKMRHCLRCRGEFRSEGAHHRLCGDCNALSHVLSPMEPDPGGHNGRRVGARR